MGILNPPPFPTEGDDDDAEMAAEDVVAGDAADVVHSAVHAAVSAGIGAALGALNIYTSGPTGDAVPSQSGLSDEEAALLDAYRQSSEMHRLTALRTLQRGITEKDD